MPFILISKWDGIHPVDDDAHPDSSRHASHACSRNGELLSTQEFQDWAGMEDMDCFSSNSRDGDDVDDKEDEEANFDIMCRHVVMGILVYDETMTLTLLKQMMIRKMKQQRQVTIVMVIPSSYCDDGRSK